MCFKQYYLRTFFYLLVLGSFSFNLSFAQETESESGLITLNLKDTNIRALIETMSDISGKNFIIDPRVKGNVTVVSSKPVTAEEAYEIFVSVLKVHGFAVIQSGEVYKVILAAGAKQENVPTVNNISQYRGDNFVTQVIKLQHTAAANLVAVLKPLLPDNAHIAADFTSNSLLVTDSMSNIQRIQEVIRQIDVKDDAELETIKLRNMRPTDLTNLLENLEGKQQANKKDLSRSNRVVAYERSNSVILKGDGVWRSRVRQLIRELDKPTNQNSYTDVIFLKHANAKNLVDILKGVGQQQLKTQEQAGSSTAAGKTNFDLQADESTNSLIITAPPFLANSLKAVIERLDIRRSQVHIQAIIAEVKYDKAMELGVEWNKIPNDGFAGTISLPLSGGVTSSITSYPTNIGSGFSLGYISSGSLRGLIKAFASDTDTNILSTPSIVTLDNEEASIHVGQNVPFVTGQYTLNDSNAGENPFQTIEREDVGIKLKVKPHINEGDTIKLEIEQEVSNVDTTSTVDGIVTNKRLIDTTVLVDNEEIIVLGGLVQDEVNESTSKVPLLGDVPVLGHLFRSERSVKDKRNLMVFLRPVIIRDQKSLREITQKNYEQIQRLQQDMFKNGLQLIMEDHFELPAQHKRDM